MPTNGIPLRWRDAWPGAIIRRHGYTYTIAERCPNTGHITAVSMHDDTEIDIGLDAFDRDHIRLLLAHPPSTRCPDAPTFTLSQEEHPA